MYFSIFKYIFVLVCFVAPFGADASVVMRSGSTVNLPPESVVKGDFYVFGNEVVIAGSVEGDLYVMGNQVTITGSVGGDVVVVGVTVSLHGQVGDDARIVAAKSLVSNAVESDLLMAGGSMTTLSSTKVGGDTIVYGTEATLGGETSGTVKVYSSTLIFEGSAENLEAHVRNMLELRSDASIEKDFSYESGNEPIRSPESVVGGSVVRLDTGSFAEPAPNYRGFVILVFALILSGLTSVFMAGRSIQGVFTVTPRTVGVAALIGIGIFFSAPLLSVLLFLSQIGFLLGLLGLFLYGALVVSALILVPVYIGSLCAFLYTKSYQVSWLWTLGGVAIVALLFMIPGGIGALLYVLLTPLICGLLLHRLFRRVRTAYEK